MHAASMRKGPHIHSAKPALLPLPSFASSCLAARCGQVRWLSEEVQAGQFVLRLCLPAPFSDLQRGGWVDSHLHHIESFLLLNVELYREEGEVWVQSH